MSIINTGTNVKATAVVLGGTGLIGIYISKCLLTEYRNAFPCVRVTTRDVNTPSAKDLAALGAEVHSFQESLLDVVAGADVIINAIPPHIPEEVKQRTNAALAACTAKVYFMSEYGVDYSLNDFPGYDHTEWTIKRVDTANAYAATGEKTKIIAVITGIFLATLTVSYSSAIGVDVKANAFSALGSADAKWAIISEIDIARCVAQLSVLALDPATAATVPNSLRVAPFYVSHAEIAAAVAKVRGVPQAQVKVEDLAAFKDNLSKHPSEDVFPFIRVMMGEGKLDWSDKNDSEFVNPGESLWKWKTLEDEIREVA